MQQAGRHDAGAVAESFTFDPSAGEETESVTMLQGLLKT